MKRLLLAALLFCSTATVYAIEGGYTYTVDQTHDYFVVIEQPAYFTAETDLCPDTENYWCAAPPFTDSVLWLYDAQGELLAANDDDPRRSGGSWNSYIEIELQPGVYRLRAGRFFCIDGQGCINPANPFPEGGRYDLLSNLPLVLDPTPPEASPPPVPSVLPSAEPTEVPPTIEPTPDPSLTPEPSPSVEPSPSPSPSLTPEPTPAPSPTPAPTPRHTPSPTPEPSPSPTDTPLPPTPEPSLPPPTPEPFDPGSAAGKAVSAVAEAAGAAVAAVADTVSQALDDAAQEVGKAVAAVTRLGSDITPEGRKKARTIALPAVIVQIVAAASAATNAAASAGRLRK